MVSSKVKVYGCMRRTCAFGTIATIEKITFNAYAGLMTESEDDEGPKNGDRGMVGALFPHPSGPPSI